MRRTQVWGVSAGLLLFGTVFAQQQGTVNSGVGRAFNIADLTGDKLGRIVASTEFQVSLTLPTEVQNVGVNAAKQSVLIPTVDESDGRVIYLDVLKAGGFATLNVRLINKGEPVILKLTVELSDKTSGVLSYTIRNGPSAASAVKPAVPSTAQKTPAAALPTAPAPARAASLPAGSAARGVEGGGPPSTSAVTVPAPKPAVPPRPAVPRTPAPTPSPTGVEGISNSVRVSLTKDQAASTATTDHYTYRAQLTGSAREALKFILLPKTQVRSRTGTFLTDAATLTPNRPTVITAAGVTGRVVVVKGRLGTTSSVLLLTVSTVDSATQKVLPERYVGLALKP